MDTRVPAPSTRQHRFLLGISLGTVIRLLSESLASKAQSLHAGPYRSSNWNYRAQ